MRAMRARGHEVVGVCADGPLLDGPRAEGFRVEAAAAERSLSPASALAGVPRAAAAVPRRAARTSCTRICRSAASWRGWRHGAAGVPVIAYTVPWLPVQLSRLRGRAAPLGFAMEWLGGRVTDVFLTVQRARRATPGGCTSIAAPSPSAMAATRRASGPIPRRRARIRAALGVPDEQVVVLAVSRLVWHKGYPELAAAMRDVPGCGAVGRRRAADVGSRPGHGGAASRDAGLGERLRLLGYRDDVAGPAGGGGYLRAAEPVRGPADVGDRGDADRAAGGRRPTSAGPREQVVPEVTGLLVPPMTVAPLAAALAAVGGRPGACGRAWARRAASARSSVYDEAKVVARTLDLLGLVGLPRHSTPRHDRHRPDPPRADLGFRQDRSGAVCAGAGGERRGDPVHRRLGQGAARGGRAGEGGFGAHRLSGDPGRPGEDAGAADPWRHPGPARQRRTSGADGGARHRADRPGRGEPLSVRGDGGAAVPRTTSASRTSTSAVRR